VEIEARAAGGGFGDEQVEAGGGFGREGRPIQLAFSIWRRVAR